MRFSFFVAELRTKTEQKRWEVERVEVVTRRQLKGLSLFQRTMTKKVVNFFEEKIGRHREFAAARDTNLSDATARVTNFRVINYYYY